MMVRENLEYFVFPTKICLEKLRTSDTVSEFILPFQAR